MCCSALSGSPRWRTSSSASSPVRLKRGPSAVSSTLTLVVIPSAEVTRFRKSTIGVVFIGPGLPHQGRLIVAGGRIGLAAAHAFHPALAGRRPRCPNVRRPDQVVRQILLADRPDVVDQPVERHTRRVPEKQKREEYRHQHHHLLL